MIAIAFDIGIRKRVKAAERTSGPAEKSSPRPSS